MARELKRTYDGSGMMMGGGGGGSCAAASVLGPSMRYDLLARNGEMGSSNSSSAHVKLERQHQQQQQQQQQPSSAAPAAPAAAASSGTSFLTGGRSQAQAAAAAAGTVHEAHSGCALTESSSALINNNNGSSCSQNGGSGSHETVDKGVVVVGGCGGENPPRSADDWWVDSWGSAAAITAPAAAPAPPPHAQLELHTFVASAQTEFGAFKGGGAGGGGGGGYGNYDELDSIMLMLPAPPPDQTLMRYLMGESQSSHQQQHGSLQAFQQACGAGLGGGLGQRLKDMDSVMTEQDSWSSNHEQQKQQQQQPLAQSEISHPHGRSGDHAATSFAVVVPSLSEPGSFLTPSFPPSLPRALSLPSHMRNITLNSAAAEQQQQQHLNRGLNSEVSVRVSSINTSIINGPAPSGCYPFPAPTSGSTSSSMAAAAAGAYSDSPDSSSSVVPGDFFRQTLLHSNTSNGFPLQASQENNSSSSFVPAALQASMAMKEVQTSPSSNQAFAWNQQQHQQVHQPPSLGPQGSSSFFYQDSQDMMTTTTIIAQQQQHRNLQRSFTSLPSLSSMDQQMKLQGMGANREYLLQRQKSWQPSRRSSPSSSSSRSHFVSDHHHHIHHHHLHANPHHPHPHPHPHTPQNTPAPRDWKLDMSRIQTRPTTSLLSPSAAVQAGGFTFSSPKLESGGFKGEEKKQQEGLGLVNPDTGQQQQEGSGGGSVIPEGGLTMVTYLLKAAEAAEVGNTEVAKAILARLNQHISPARGRAFHRVAYYFQQALLTHMMIQMGGGGGGAGAAAAEKNFTDSKNSSSSSPSPSASPSSSSASASATALQLLLQPDRSLPLLEAYYKINAYVQFCEVSPFPKFAHFTANQAIMEALEGESSIHVIDFRLGYGGAQWASFLHDIASMRAAATAVSGGKFQTPPPPDYHPRGGGSRSVRLTAVGPNADEMHAIGANLSAFAHSLNLSLEFQAVVVASHPLLELSMLNLREREAIAVNFVFSLHCLLDDTFSNGLSAVLRTVRDAKPKVITVVEQEANHNGANFQERFSEAFQYYLFLFDSLSSSASSSSLEEPPIPAGSCGASDDSLVNFLNAKIRSIENYLLAPEILNIVAAEGASRVERHERLEQWRIRMCTAGFQSRPLSDASHFQADKLLSERSAGHRRGGAGGGGFQVARDNGCLLLGWQGRPLLAASSWTC